MILPDVNMLVYAHREDSQDHRARPVTSRVSRDSGGDIP